VPKSTCASARPALHPAERKRPRRGKAAHEPLHAVVAACKALLGHQVLPDPLGRELLVEFCQDQREIRLALIWSAAEDEDRIGYPRGG